MCRLFGFRSVILSRVHTSLVSAENALMLQSQAHPDGWGVAYYLTGVPHIVKSVQTAVSDTLFKRVSGLVSSQTVLAHIRKATHGPLSILNTHPFQFGRWVFAHNGNIKSFKKYRKALLSKVDQNLRRYLLGETDSELVFFVLLSHIQKHQRLSDPVSKIQNLADAVKGCVKEITGVVGSFNQQDDADPSETFLTFLITDGISMIAHQGGKSLFYSTYKTSCSERNVCPSFAYECENPTKSGQVNHLIFSSEPLSGENVWLQMQPGEIIGVDHSMKLWDTFD